ncbi:hypothetical protein ABIB75_004521, partial [Bradyrhizobium sp. GM2.2]|uniref:hypothetical protein n=1 Tax=Bradyrhizobium sp. GM2.2 TaxID=3156358 RepID=UPI003391B835
MYDGLLFRTRAQAANSNRRIALDLRLADRLEAKGIRAYRYDAVERNVDLATEGGLSESCGRPLINCNLFGSQFIRKVVRISRELVAYEAQHGRSDHIASLTIRAPRDLLDPEEADTALLDAQGNAPLRNLRRVHCITGDLIQRALEYMEKCGWLKPLVIARHADPMDGGAAFDWHAHVTVDIHPECSAKIAQYLYRKFGRDRIWISSEEEPGVRRDLVATGCYAPAKLANRGFEDVSDEHLREFFEQSAGLRRIDIAGPVRAARDAERPLRASKVAASSPEAELAAIEAAADEMLDSIGPDEILSPEKTGSDAVAGLSGDAADGNTNPTPRLVRCHFAYIGLSLRWVARVSNYAGWDDLLSRYDLASDVVHAKKLAARAAHLLYLNPASPESYTDESFDFESLAEWEPLRDGRRRSGPAPAGETEDNQARSATDAAA